MEHEQVTQHDVATDVPPEETETYDEPRGAYRFVILMLILYFVYFFVTWIEVVLGRGA